MPYKIIGDIVKNTQTGEVKGHSDNPKKYLRTLMAVEHGWKPGQHISEAAQKMRGK